MNKLRSLQNLLALSVVTLIITVWATVSFLAYQNSQLKKYSKDNLIKTSNSKSHLLPAPTVYQTSNEFVKDWKTYTNEKYGYEFKYPQNLKIIEKDGAVTLNHSIPYDNNGDCDMMAGKFSKYLNDFNVSFEIKTSEEVELPSYFDGNYQSGILSGKWYWAGAEGCGPNIYYFPLQEDKTLVITQDTLQAFSGISTMWDTDKILNSPGVITQKEYDKLFSQILSTFKFTDTNNKLSIDIKLKSTASINETQDIYSIFPQDLKNSIESITPLIDPSLLGSLEARGGKRGRYAKMVQNKIEIWC